MESPAQTIWCSALGSLREVLNPEVYKLWFAPIQPLSITSDRLSLGVANDFCAVWLGENYRDVIENALKTASGRQIEFSFVAQDASVVRSKSLATNDLTQIKATEAPAPVREDLSEALPLFDPKNTFDSFVVGNNQLAHAAAVAVAQNPGRSYNPLFLIGGVGLGKTHLLHAIGQHVSQNLRTAKVAYVSTERFTNEFIDALQNSRLIRFRKKFRETDVLLIDDIHFLAGKERIQEEFFHTFNALKEARKQIVMTCDRPANEIQGLENRLVSRFEWGLVADIQPPDIETRLAILRKKSDQMRYTLEPEVAQFLAERIRANIRRLEGALTRVASYSRLTGHPITVDRVRELLRDVLSEEGRASLTIDVIIKRVADHFDLRVADILGRRRPDSIAFPRQVAMYLARTLTESSLSTIGEAFGGRDHGTVLHACRAVTDRMETDSGVRKAVHQLDRELRG
ncbi:MAG: chromosomal replication initiator protein DnaA [Limisphaerales bacterium]